LSTGTSENQELSQAGSNGQAPPPDPLHPILTYLPTRLMKLPSSPTVAVAAILAGQGNNRSLRPSPLPQQPAGMLLGNLIVLPGMPDRATPPLRA